MQRTLLAHENGRTPNGLFAMRAVRFLDSACNSAAEGSSARAEGPLASAEAHSPRALAGNVLWVVTGAALYSARPRVRAGSPLDSAGRRSMPFRVVPNHGVKLTGSWCAPSWPAGLVAIPT